MLLVLWQADFDPAGVLTETGWAQLDLVQSAIVALNREAIVLHECTKPQSVVTAQFLARGLGVARPICLSAGECDEQKLRAEFGLDRGRLLPMDFGRLAMIRYLRRRFPLVIVVTAGSRLTFVPDDLAALDWIDQTAWLSCRQAFSEKYTQSNPPYCRGFAIDFIFDPPREFPYS